MIQEGNTELTIKRTIEPKNLEFVTKLLYFRFIWFFTTFPIYASTAIKLYGQAH